jgi:NitT/TauT family transport system substrate-binding protein
MAQQGAAYWAGASSTESSTRVQRAPAGQVVRPQADLRLGIQPDLALPSVLVAQEQGWLEEVGLSLELRHLGWGEIADSLESSSLEVGLLSPVAHLLVGGQGRDLRVVAAGATESATSRTRALVVAPGGPVQTGRDLASRRVVLAGSGAPDYFALLGWLERHGVDPRTVEFGEAGAPQLWPAVAEGRAAAALLAEPYLSAAVERGAQVLASPYEDQAGSTPLSYFVADAAWLRDHGDVARRFAQAVHRAHAYLEADPTAHRDAMVRHLGFDPALTRRVALPTLETRLTPTQIQGWADLLARATPPEQAASLARTAAADLLFDSVR